MDADAVQEFYQRQVKPLTPDARLHLAQLILEDLNEFAKNWAIVQGQSDRGRHAEQWLREASELRRSIMNYRASRGMSPVMSQEEMNLLLSDTEPDDKLSL
jgi:hypothetical protein